MSQQLQNPVLDAQRQCASELSYVLITPARNEAENIERVIECVIQQTVRPLRWVVVSDGSTDGTDAIVQRFAAVHPWIELLRMPERAERHFGGKARAFNAACEKLKGLKFDIIGNLDADLSFGPDYFSFLLSRFANDPKLGVAGTPFREDGQMYNYQFASLEHVSGACQMFRRICFESIGGYTPLKVGGIDLVAVTTARMKGWQTRTFTERVTEHHRKTQCGNHASLKARFWSGYHDYLMGVYPPWQFLRSVYHLRSAPVLLGGSMLLAGFCWALLTRAERPVSPEFVEFRHAEQRQRLRQLLKNWGRKAS